MKWQWRDPADPRRTVTLDYNYWSGGKQLAVDGITVPAPQKLGLRWSHTFDLGARAATVHVRVKYLVDPQAELTVDGQPVLPVEAPRAIPAWAWLFALANVAILVASRGGALPGLIAGVGGAGVIGVSRAPLSSAARLGLAFAITAAAWGAFALLVRALTS
jgi:hypothetical protein